jgi:hypothetical protein
MLHSCDIRGIFTKPLTNFLQSFLGREDFYLKAERKDLKLSFSLRSFTYTKNNLKMIARRYVNSFTET